MPVGRLADLTSDYDAPGYGSINDVPSDYMFAEVDVTTARVSWSGKQIDGYGGMTYFGNRGSIDFALKVLHDYSTVATDGLSTSTGSFLPEWRIQGDPYTFLTASDCGQTANLSITYGAKSVVIINWAITTIGSASDFRQPKASQSACSETTTISSGPGGDKGGETWCLVEITYDLITGEILDVQVLTCWVE